MLVLVIGMANAQPKMKFDKTVHDFGVIKEDGGKQTARFEFTNEGTSDLILETVKASCGCTTAEYTKTPIAPGQRGFIDAVYNPMGRPGGFNKTVTVKTNEVNEAGEQLSYLLNLKGEVSKKEPTLFEKAGFTVGYGMTRIKNSDINVNMKSTETHIDTLILKNFWNKNVTVKFKSLPDGFQEVSRSFGSALDSGKDGFIVVSYNPALAKKFGEIKEQLIIETNDSLESNKVVRYQIHVTPDFSNLTKAQLKKAPQYTISDTVVNFGSIRLNSGDVKSVMIKNTGKAALTIYQVISDKIFYKVQADNVIVEPGQTYELKITAMLHREGVQPATLTLITDDPTKSEYQLLVKATGTK